ncbi:PREDICTED: ER lumen protein-retaining receptor 2, partial [Acanthisitta chloris]
AFGLNFEPCLVQSILLNLKISFILRLECVSGSFDYRKDAKFNENTESLHQNHNFVVGQMMLAVAWRNLPAIPVRLYRNKIPSGISGKSQLLFALVFTTRYLDLFTSFISLYNTSMKLIYIACSYATVYLIYMKFKATYDGNHDTFRVEFLIVPVGGLSFLVNHDFSPLEILWTFSIYLESVAILPQLFMISKTGEAETITTHYLFFLGLYRALYLVNWIWRYYFEGFFDLIAVVAGVVQTVLYCDFFYLYVTKVLKGKKLSLPA